MRSLVRCSMVGLVLNLVVGCGWLGGDKGVFRDRSDQYREAPLTERMELPAGVDAPAINDLYQVPEQQLSLVTSEKFEVPEPESIVTSNQTDVRAFRSGNRYWLAATGSPAEAWARVRRFWELNDIDLELEIPSRGVLETVWLSRSKDGIDTRDRFRIRVEHGMHEDSSEVYIMHLGVPADDSELPPTDQIDWSQVEEDDEVAIAIMQELASYLIETEYEGGSASLLAQSFIGSPKSSISKDQDGNPILLLKLDFNRAWESVGKAITDDSLTELSDKNRSSGVYYINYFPDAESGDEGGGFFSFLSFGGKKDKKGKPQAYLVKLEPQGEQIRVRVSSEHEDERDLSNAVLATLKDNLI